MSSTRFPSASKRQQHQASSSGEPVEINLEEFTRQATTGTCVVKFFGDCPSAEEVAMRLNAQFVNTILSEVVDHFTCSLDLTQYDAEGNGVVVHDCYHFLIECPLFFEYRYRVIGFNDEHMMDALMLWCDFRDDCSRSDLEIACFIRDKLHNHKDIAGHRDEANYMVAWFFNQKKIVFDLYEHHIPLDEDSTTLLGYYQSHGQRSAPFVYVMHREFKVDPNPQTLDPTRDKELIQYLKIATQHRDIARRMLFMVGVIHDETS